MLRVCVCVCVCVVSSPFSVREVLSCKVGCKQVVFPSPYWDQISDAAKVVSQAHICYLSLSFMLLLPSLSLLLS